MPNPTPQTHRNDSSLADPYKWNAIGVLSLFMITIPIIIIVVVSAGPPTSEGVRIAPVATSSPPAEPLSPGEVVYQNTCQVCHGADANGIVGLGKPLRNSAYIQDNDDAEVFRNIAEGRLPEDPLNTSGVAMPARGAKNISDDQIRDVVAYLRTLQDPSQPRASIEAWIKAPPTEGSQTEVAFDGPGRELFVKMCSACHGPDGQGMEGLGKPFVTSRFVKDSTDKEVMTMVKMGRPIWDAANTTGVDMPPKGGNPALSDEDLAEIIKYIRSINTLDD